MEQIKDNIKVKYFDIKGNETNTERAVKAEVYFYGQNNELEKIDYYHIKPTPKNPKALSI